MCICSYFSVRVPSCKKWKQKECYRKERGGEQREPLLLQEGRGGGTELLPGAGALRPLILRFYPQREPVPFTPGRATALGQSWKPGSSQLVRGHLPASLHQPGGECRCFYFVIWG